MGCVLLGTACVFSIHLIIDCGHAYIVREVHA